MNWVQKTINGTWGRAQRLRLFHKQAFGVLAKAIALDEAPSKVIILNNKLQVVFWNKKDEATFGYKEDEILSKIPDHLFFNGHKLAFIELCNKWKESGSLDERDLELGMQKKNGERIPVEATFVSRRIIEEFYLFIIIRDISDRKKIEQQFQKELELYKYGERVGHFGSWYWDVIENKVFVSEGFRNIFSTDAIEEGSEYFMKRVHPEDRLKVAESIRNGFKTESDYAIPSYRVISDNYQWREIMCIAEAKKNEDGKLIAFLGFIKFVDTDGQEFS